MKPNGFSLIELMVVGGISAGLAVGIAGTLTNQQKALKGLYAKIEVQTIRTNIAEILKDEGNCTATLRAFSPSVPTLEVPIEITQVLVRKEVNGEVIIRPFYETNKVYDAGVKIRSMRVRPNNPERDATPGPKFEMIFEVSAKIIGPNEFTRKLEFFSSPIASTAFPEYAFKCGLGSAASIAGGIIPPPITAPVTDGADGDNGATGPAGVSPEIIPEVVVATITCAQHRLGSVTCPGTKRPVACMVGDTNENSSEDKAYCSINVANRTCSFQIEREENCDNLIPQCVCI